MVTNKTKNGRKFIKMYDPETGEYRGGLTDEEVKLLAWTASGRIGTQP